MREKMISWMVEDILPQVKKRSKPETVLLKFAGEQNMTPAILEGMGHLYNTAKTLSFLEKSANRGATFPIIDVPELVDKYLEVRPTKKAEIEKSADVLDNLYDLPDIFGGVVAVEPDPTKGTLENPEKRASHKRSWDKIQIEFIKQSQFDLHEDALGSINKIGTKLREAMGDYPFHQLEQDALYAIGPEIKPTMDKIAKVLIAAHIPVKRASDAGARRLVKDPYHLLDQVDHVFDCLCKLAAAEEMLKEASPAPAAVENDVIHEKMTGERSGDNDAPRGGGKGGGKGGQMKFPGDGGSGGGAKKKGPASSSEPASYFGHINKGLDAVGVPLLKRVQTAGESLFGGGRNSGQEEVDTAHQEARHLAVLQNLMHTDEVLAEADPDQVVSIYNTLKENAPELAGDPNTARVILRSAIQHDGISPFDLKSFLDTEAARQKVMMNQHTLDDRKYSGKPLPKPKEDRQ